MNQQDRQERIERGRQAVVAASLVDPFIEDALKALQAAIVSDVRGGKLDTNKLLTQAGQMTALVMLQQEFESQTRQGNGAAQLEYEHG